MRAALVILIAMVMAALVACQSGPVDTAGDPDDSWKPWHALAGGDTLSWTLSVEPGPYPGISHLRDLADTLALYGIRAEPCSGEEFRLGYSDDELGADWMAEKWENEAGFLADTRRVLDGQFRTLLTHQGLSDDSLAVEILGGGGFLESITGEPCRVFAYPMHDHDWRDMEFLRDQGYLAARSGLPGIMPWGPFLLESGERDNGWGALSLYETPISLSCEEVQATPPEAMSDWLADGYLDEWRQDRRWVQLYTHTDDPSVTGTAVLDTLHLGAFLDALLDTGEFWIAPLGEVAEHARDYHGPSAPQDLVWRSEQELPGPWKGRDCAFTFSTDDGFLANLEGYRHCLAARGLSYTAFLNRHKIEAAESWNESPYMDSAEVAILSASGVEIGNHGANHRCLLRQEAIQLMLDRPASQLTLEIGSEGGQKVLRLWEDGTAGVP